MKQLPLFWNITRCALCILCCYQLILFVLDAKQAERMLYRREGPDSYLQTQKAIDLEQIDRVLNRRGQSSLIWLGLLTLVALSPYARVSRLATPPEANKRGIQR